MLQKWIKAGLGTFPQNGNVPYAFMFRFVQQF